MNSDFRYSSNGYEIVDSGVLYAFTRSSDIGIEISIPAEKNETFRMKMIFNFVENGKELSIGREVRGNTVNFTCYNFTNVLGSGSNQPIELADINGRKLYMHLWVFLNGDTTRKVEYTIYFRKAGE